MKLKKIGKLTMIIAAGTALVAALINDNKEKPKSETKDEEIKQGE